MSLSSKFFPKDFADQFLSSKYPIILKYHRLISSLFFVACMILYLITYGIVLLRYLTIQTFLLNSIFYTISFICYFYEPLKPVCYVLFEVIWSLNCVVTIAYWGYISPYSYDVSQVMGSIIPHTVPFLMTVIDFILNQIKFYRLHYLFPLVFLIVYSFCVLLPVTLFYEIVYPGITFHNWVTYVFIFSMITFGMFGLELGKFIKEKCRCFNENSLDSPTNTNLIVN